MPIVTVPDDATQVEIKKAFFKVADPVYAIYKQGKRLFILKSKEGHPIKRVSVKNCKAFIAFTKSFDEILHETILPNSYVNKEGDTIQTYVDHFSITDLYLILGNKRKKISVNWFNVRPTDNPFKDKGRITHKNINYLHNKRTKIIALTSLLENEIPKKINSTK
jgi:hypothetical protein